MHLTFKIKNGKAIFICFDIFYSLILAVNIVIYLSFVIEYKCQYFEIGSNYSQTFAMKIVNKNMLKYVVLGWWPLTNKYFKSCIIP